MQALPPLLSGTAHSVGADAVADASVPMQFFSMSVRRSDSERYLPQREPCASQGTAFESTLERARPGRVHNEALVCA